MRSQRIAFVLLGVLTPALALAQSPEDALLNECYTLRRAGRHAASLPRCAEAAERFPSGRSLTQLGLTEAAMERWVDAATHLAAALADRSHPWMQANRASVEESFRAVQAQVGTLEVGTNAADATVSVAGGPARPAAERAFARPGRATVTLRAGDGRALTREVTLTAGEVTRERMDLPVAPAAVAASTPPTRPPPPTRQPPPLSAPATGTSTRRVLAWTAGGVALAGFGLALASWRLREGAVSDYAARCQTAPDRATADRCSADRVPADEEVSRWEAVTAVGLAAGGVFAVTSVILFATEPSRRAPTTTWVCAPSLGVVGGQCAVRF